MRKKIDFVFDPLLDYHLEYLESEFNTSHNKRCGLSPEQILRQTGTVRLGFGRQIGKTTYVCRTATSQDVILTRDTTSLPYVQQMCQAHNVSGCHHIYTVKDLRELPDTMRDVWVDEAPWVDDKYMDKVYAAIAGKCRRLILIG